MDKELEYKVIQVVHSEQKTSTKGKLYLSVKDQDGIFYSCWDDGLWNLLMQNASVEIGFESSTVNNRTYRNIREVKTVAVKLEEKKESALALDKSSKPMGDSRNRAFALSYAKDLAVPMLGKPQQKLTLPFVLNLLNIAKIFETYLDTGVAPEKQSEESKENTE